MCAPRSGGSEREPDLASAPREGSPRPRIFARARRAADTSDSFQSPSPKTRQHRGPQAQLPKRCVVARGSARAQRICVKNAQDRNRMKLGGLARQRPAWPPGQRIPVQNRPARPLASGSRCKAGPLGPLASGSPVRDRPNTDNLPSVRSGFRGKYFAFLSPGFISHGERRKNIPTPSGLTSMLDVRFKRREPSAGADGPVLCAFPRGINRVTKRPALLWRIPRIFVD